MSAKYKAHKLVNVFFYLIVFFVGVLIGLGAKSLNFSRIISQFLMIDNVEAYSATVPMNNSYKVTSSNYYDEEKLYNLFNYVFNDSLELGFDFTDYQHVYSLYASNGTANIYYCSESMSIGGNSNKIWFNPVNYGCYRIYYAVSSFMISSEETGSNYSKDSYYMASTEDHSSLMGSRFKKVLDFTDFLTVNLEFDENLFANDENFKEVCVNNFESFSITSNQIQDYDENNNPLYHSFDFIWFKNGVKGISTYLYDSEVDSHVVVFEKQDDDYLSSPYGWWFWLNSKDEIDKYWNSPNSPGLELITRGYTDKYKYYNYTLYPFTMTFTTDYHRYQIFWFKNPYIEDLDGNKSYPDKYCFYIKNEYDVNIYNKNSSGDFYSDINVLGDITYHDQTFENELNQNVNGLFSTITVFISRMYSTISFINLNIFNFYSSMPLIVRLFIMTFLTLVVIRILIGMVIR